MATKTTLTPFRRDGWETTTDVLRLYGTHEGNAKIERDVVARTGNGDVLAKHAVTTVSKADAVRLGLVGEIDVSDLTESQREWVALETAGELEVDR